MDDILFCELGLNAWRIAHTSRVAKRKALSMLITAKQLPQIEQYDAYDAIRFYIFMNEERKYG